MLGSLARAPVAASGDSTTRSASVLQYHVNVISTQADIVSVPSFEHLSLRNRERLIRHYEIVYEFDVLPLSQVSIIACLVERLPDLRLRGLCGRCGGVWIRSGPIQKDDHKLIRIIRARAGN